VTNRDRDTLVWLTMHFNRVGLWSSGPKPVLMRISSETRDTAMRFFMALPDSKRSPQICPDSDGYLLVVWDLQTEPVWLTIDGETLSASIGAGTPESVHIGDVKFGNGEWIPPQILNAIPDQPVVTCAHA
jgi:hypothetical protein